MEDLMIYIKEIATPTGISYSGDNTLSNNDANKIIEIIKENEKLKLELSGYRQAILNDDKLLGLQQENKKLKNKFDKVVDYIENNKLYNYVYDDEELFEVISDKKAKKDLLQALKGSDNNDKCN
jgi:hypothetical protein